MELGTFAQIRALRDTLALFEEIQIAARNCSPEYQQKIADAIKSTREILAGL